MELRHLRYFIAVAETGSLTEAAEKRLYTSQPSLSRQIRDLEDQVGAPLFLRTARGVELTAAGKAFMDHARLALSQVDAAVAAARRAAQPLKQRFAIGFLTGQEMTWLPDAMRILRDELPGIEVNVSSDYSPDLADGLARGKLDLAFLRAETGFDLEYRKVREEPLIVLMPSDHPLSEQNSIRLQDLVGQPFVAMANKASMVRAVVDAYVKREGVELTVTQEVDNPAMVMSLVASTRGFALVPDYVRNLLPWSVVSRPLAGEPPTVDLVVGYSRSNTSGLLKLFLSRLGELKAAPPH